MEDGPTQKRVCRRPGGDDGLNSKPGDEERKYILKDDLNLQRAELRVILGNSAVSHAKLRVMGISASPLFKRARDLTKSGKRLHSSDVEWGILFPKQPIPELTSITRGAAGDAAYFHLTFEENEVELHFVSMPRFTSFMCYEFDGVRVDRKMEYESETDDSDSDQESVTAVKS